MNKTSRTKLKFSQGVAGRAYRTRKVCLEIITGEFDDQIIANWGFSREEVARFTKRDRKSFFAVPVPSPDNSRIVGVLSLDSKEMDTFTPEHTRRVEAFVPYFSRLLTRAAHQPPLEVPA